MLGAALGAPVEPVVAVAGEPVVAVAGEPVVAVAGEPVVAVAAEPVVAVAGEPAVVDGAPAAELADGAADAGAPDAAPLLVDGLGPEVAVPAVPPPALLVLAAGVEVGCVVLVAAAQGAVGVPGKEPGTCSTSPGWKLADMSPLPAGPSVRPSTWPISWRTTVTRSMCMLAGSAGKSTPHPQPAASVETVIVVPLVMPSSRSGRVADVTVTQPRSAAGTIADQSEMACEAAAASSAALTPVLTGVDGAAAAVESIGLADEPVADELEAVDDVELGEVDELAAGVVDGDVPVPVEAEPDVALVLVEVPPDPVAVPLDPVALDEDESVPEAPVEVPLEEGVPTVTVCDVLVPLVVVVVVPFVVVVVDVELLVVDTGHDTDWACITTPGPKLQLLDAELGAEPALVDPAPAADDPAGPAPLVAAGTEMVTVLVTVVGAGAAADVFAGGG